MLQINDRQITESGRDYPYRWLTTVFATFYQLSDAMMEVKLKISKSDGRALHHPRDKASTTWFYEEPVTFYNLLNAVIQSS
jgi:hypothetical protein